MSKFRTKLNEAFDSAKLTNALALIIVALNSWGLNQVYSNSQSLTKLETREDFQDYRLEQLEKRP